MPSPHQRGPRPEAAASFSGPEQLRRPRTLRIVQPGGPDLPSSTKLLLDAAAQMDALAADATDEQDAPPTPRPTSSRSPSA